MTYTELHEILDNENRKISLSEFRNILNKMKTDTFYEQTKNIDVCENKYQWYLGEANGFQIALDLSEHIADYDKEVRKQVCDEIIIKFGKKPTESIGIIKNEVLGELLEVIDQIEKGSDSDEN